MSQSSYHGGESIAPDPVDPNVVYAAAGMYRGDPAAMLRSHDRGDTWEVFPVQFKMGGNEDGRGLGERLAVDPNDTQILYFGSRHDGLLRSTDNAKTWHRVESFPLKGGGQGGLSFVAFDPSSGSKGNPSQTIFVGSADAGNQHLFRSTDGGQTWSAVDGGPDAKMLPIQGKISSNDILYITFGNGIGPNGVTDGCVFAFDIKSGQWANITPDKSPNHPRGGYAGLSLDHQNPSILAVSTFNRWGPTDTVWRTTDGGKTWLDIAGKAQRDITASPFLTFGQRAPKLGWWLAALAIDPFDSDHVVYATGATVFASNDFSNVSREQPTHWAPWVTGIEQTAIITLSSPTGGPHLLSGFGDIGGFVHDDLDHSPPQGMFTNPVFTNTDSIDYAGKQPNVVVRTGRGGRSPCAYSEDGGHTWQPLPPPPAADQGAPAGGQGRRGGGGGGGQQVGGITVSADGKEIILQGRITADFGKTWNTPTGLPAGARIVVDRVNPKLFYAMSNQQLLVSNDAGATFQPQQSQGLPNQAGGNRAGGGGLKAATDKEGDLWIVGRGGLMHSSDAGKTFTRTGDGLQIQALAFGKAPAGNDYPALFAIGNRGNLKAIWRSDDQGQSWIRINDEAHQYGTRFRCIEGDPRIFGRVYIGTDGRGVFYADPVNAG
jgi:photosystem II stability/assembly factor-like uncharacterized protein